MNDISDTTYTASRFLVGAASSGSGKTTLSLGLMRTLRDSGYNISPFKCGPDYIDTSYHSIAAGRPSVNLDTFMSSENHVKEIFTRHSADADVSIVEGVMGLFDGYDRYKGSSSAIAELLDIPVILVVNAASTAYSVAATIYGFKNFRPATRIAAVVFNNVASQSHFAYLRHACEDAGVECAGYMKRDKDVAIPSRHLGLSLSSIDVMESYIEKAASLVRENVDIDLILKLTTASVRKPDKVPAIKKGNRVIAVARDEAFNFIYTENIAWLESQCSGDIKFFSPIHDRELPECDFVYLPGGYPELFADELSANKSMRRSIAEYIENGGKLFAECGGMIYLTRSIDGCDMCGILPMNCTMDGARLHLGYRIVKTESGTFKGHEFHYSSLDSPLELKSIAEQTTAGGSKVDTPLYRYKNAICGYTHLYWGDNDLFKLWNK